MNLVQDTNILKSEVSTIDIWELTVVNFYARQLWYGCASWQKSPRLPTTPYSRSLPLITVYCWLNKFAPRKVNCALAYQNKPNIYLFVLMLTVVLSRFVTRLPQFRNFFLVLFRRGLQPKLIAPRVHIDGIFNNRLIWSNADVLAGVGNQKYQEPLTLSAFG